MHLLADSAVVGVILIPMSEHDAPTEVKSVYFFPDRPVSEDEVRRALGSGTIEEKADVISHLLRYADWDDIWRYVSREEVRDIFSILELPDSLRAAWARMLKIEPVLSP